MPASPRNGTFRRCDSRPLISVSAVEDESIPNELKRALTNAVAVTGVRSGEKPLLLPARGSRVRCAKFPAQPTRRRVTDTDFQRRMRALELRNNEVRGRPNYSRIHYASSTKPLSALEGHAVLPSLRAQPGIRRASAKVSLYR